MRDTVTVGVLAGIAGTIVLNVLTILVRLVGINTTTPWDVATRIFLTSQYVGTIYGYIVGLTGSLALGITVGILTSILVRFTGKDYSWLKGILAAEAIGFAGLGLIAPILGINLKNQPVTNIFAIIALTIFGLTVGFFIHRYAAFEAKEEN